MRHIYRIEDDGHVDLISADSAAQALDYWRENCADGEEDPPPVVQVPDCQPLTVGFEDAPPEAPKSDTKLAAHWAAEDLEPALVGSTEW